MWETCLQQRQKQQAVLLGTLLSITANPQRDPCLQAHSVMQISFLFSPKFYCLNTLKKISSVKQGIQDLITPHVLIWLFMGG